jgi:hypothetical protein
MTQAEHPKIARQELNRNAERIGLADVEVRTPQGYSHNATRRFDGDAGEGQK